MAKVHQDYPPAAEVDAWCDALLARALDRPVETRLLSDVPYEFRLGVRHTGGTYVAFESSGREAFYGFWQPAPSGRGPVLLHLPGYGAEMSAHPELVCQGYSVLHINPLGYATPRGPDGSKQVGGTWPVLPDTAASQGRSGYVDWLSDAIVATRWARQQPGVEAERYAFFGTSQGGGTALLLASLFSRRGVRCVAADLPFLVNIPLLYGRAAWVRDCALKPLAEMEKGRSADLRAAWKALGYVDVLSHAHRLTMPVLLTAASKDGTCLLEAICSLFEVLPGTRSYTELVGQEHGYTKEFVHLAQCWFRLHV